VEASLERLVDVRLAEEAGPGRYRLRGLPRLVAWEAGRSTTKVLLTLRDSRK
jgi:hypothetical protein